MRNLVTVVFLAALSMTTVASTRIERSTATKKVVCYFGSWSYYRPGNGKFYVEDIDPHLCTHAIYSFVGIDHAGSIRILDQWLDIDLGGFERFNSLKVLNPELKTLIAIGGFNEGSINFSNVCANDKLRATFVKNAVNFVLKYGFDGFDLDWEYPAQLGGIPKDKENFVKLVQELRAEFDKYDLLLTAAVAASETSASISYDIPSISKYLDFINLMEYDFHGYWDYKTGHHAPLNTSSHYQTPYEQKLNVIASVNYWLSSGAPPEKLILGMGTYGQTFTLKDSNNAGIGAPATGAGQKGPYTQQSGLLGYNEICENQKLEKSWTINWCDEQHVPFASKDDLWVGYDDVNSIEIKSKFAKDLGLGGGMVWTIETDDFHGICGEKYPLLKTINNILRTPDPEPTTEPATQKPTTEAPKPSTIEPTKTTQQIVTSSFNPSTSVEYSTSFKPTSTKPSTPSPTTSAKPSTPSPTTSAKTSTPSPTTSAKPSTHPPTTSAKPSTPSPTTSAKPSTPSPTTSAKPSTPSPTTSAKPSTPSPTTSAKPSTPSLTTSAKPSTPSPTSSVEPSTSFKPTSTKPSTPSLTTSVEPSTSSQPTSVKPSTHPPPTSTRPSTLPSSTTAIPTTTTVDPKYLCEKEGYMRDPHDCSIFYYCKWHNGEYIATQFKCPENLVFDLELQICNYRNAIVC